MVRNDGAGEPPGESDRLPAAGADALAPTLIAKSAAREGIRIAARSARDALSAAYRQEASEAACEVLSRQSQLLAAAGIGGYRAIRTELNVDGLLEDLLAADKEIYLPRVGPGRTLDLAVVSSLGEGFFPGAFGIAEPVGLALEDFSRIGAILVPGVAFDWYGGRLGSGMGYYDRLLQRLPRSVLRIGVAFECQIVPSIPIAPWDQPMDWLATEAGAFRCSPLREAG